MLSESMRSAAEQTLELLDRLEESLAAETRALMASDTDALGRAVEAKRRLLGELTSQCSVTGLDKALARKRLDRGESDPCLDRLETRIRQLRQLNETAGGAIAVLLKNTRQALGLLGVPAEPAAYGATGRGDPAARPRALGIG